MQKPVLIAEARTTRELMPGADLDAALRSGSYVLVQRPKKPSAVALRQRDFIKRRKEAGDKHLSVYLPENVYALFVSRLLPGETQAELVERLLHNITDNSQLEGQK